MGFFRHSLSPHSIVQPINRVFVSNKFQLAICQYIYIHLLINEPLDVSVNCLLLNMTSVLDDGKYPLRDHYHHHLDNQFKIRWRILSRGERRYQLPTDWHTLYHSKSENINFYNGSFPRKRYRQLSVLAHSIQRVSKHHKTSVNCDHGWRHVVSVFSYHLRYVCRYNIRMNICDNHIE